MKKAKQKQIAKERIEILLRQAEKEFPERKARANRYVQLARKLSMRYRVRMPRKLKRKFCKNCYKFIKPGVNCSVRLKEGCAIWHCKECGNEMRWPYKG